jgi:hypothetical protein
MATGEVPVVNVNAYGYSSAGLSLRSAHEDGMTVNALREQITVKHGRISASPTMLKTESSNTKLAEQALSTCLQQRGYQFHADDKNAIKVHPDEKAPVSLRMSTWIQSSDAKYAQVEVVIQAGEIVIPQHKITASKGAALMMSRNRFAALDGEEGEPTAMEEESEEEEEKYRSAYFWPAQALRLRLALEHTTKGKVMGVLDSHQYSSTTSTPTAHMAYKKFQSLQTNVQLALMREGLTDDYLRKKLPLDVRREISFGHKLRGAPVNFLKGGRDHAPMIRAAFPAGTTITYMLPAPYVTVQVEFMVRYDMDDAIEEEAAKAAVRAQARAQQDQETKGRKLKLFGKDLFDATTTKADVRQAIDDGMRAATAASGMDASYWPDNAIVDLQAGRGGQHGETAYFITVTTPASAAWLLAATAPTATHRLKFEGKLIRSHECRPRSERRTRGHTTSKRTTHTHPSSSSSPSPSSASKGPPSSSPASPSSSTHPSSPRSSSSSASSTHTRRNWSQATAGAQGARAEEEAPEQSALVTELLEQMQEMRQNQDKRDKELQAVKAENVKLKAQLRGGKQGETGRRTAVKGSDKKQASESGDGSAGLNAMLTEMKEELTQGLRTVTMEMQRMKAQLNKLENAKGELRGDLAKLGDSLRREAQSTTARLEEELRRLASAATTSPPQANRKREAPGSDPTAGVGEGAKQKKVEDESTAGALARSQPLHATTTQTGAGSHELALLTPSQQADAEMGGNH